MNILNITTRDHNRTTFRLPANPRVYIHMTNETVLENLINRRSRPLNEFRAVLRQALANMGVDQSKITYRWSQKAGCSCGCSPGFVIGGFDPVLAGRDVYVDVG